MQQPMFNWEAEDIYSKLKNLILKVNNIFESYNTPQTERIAIPKTVQEGRNAILRDADIGRKGKM